MTTTSFTRRNVSGSSAAAKARLVRGPTATRVTESGSLSRSARRISLYAGSLDGVNAWSSGPEQSSTGLIPSPSSSLAKRCTHALSAVRCGCYLVVSMYYLFLSHNKRRFHMGFHIPLREYHQVRRFRLRVYQSAASIIWWSNTYGSNQQAFSGLRGGPLHQQPI